MSGTPDSARRLVLDLVRPQVEAGRCPGCGSGLEGCGLDLSRIEPDRIEVAVRCPGCGAEAALRLQPASDGGVASIH